MKLVGETTMEQYHSILQKLHGTIQPLIQKRLIMHLLLSLEKLVPTFAVQITDQAVIL